MIVKTVRDCLWLWGQTPGCHHVNPNYRIPGVNRMTPFEGCIYMGIPNICRVVMCGTPRPPFDQESLPLETLDRVVWSATCMGKDDENYAPWGDLAEVARQARKYANIRGVVFDDFYSEKLFRLFTLERLREYKRRLSEASGREMEIWDVFYERQYKKPLGNILERFPAFDVITFWTMVGSELVHLRENLERLFTLAPGKRVMTGCYMWNYGEGRAFTPEEMRFQLDIQLEYLLAGKTEGIIFCSNCIADVGIDAVEQTREWIAEVGALPVPESRACVTEGTP